MDPAQILALTLIIAAFAAIVPANLNR